MMDAPARDFEVARNHMVDGQIRPNKVTDERILLAMRSLPREAFLPRHLSAQAYIDDDVPLGRGRVLMEPMVIARLLQLLAPRPGEAALVVGAATGYGAAVLAACGPAVTALEEDERLLAIARVALPAYAPAVRLVEGKLAEGWTGGGPWDLVLIEGAVASVPEVIVRQMKPTGRLVTVLAEGGRVGRAILGEPTAAGLGHIAAFDCTTQVLPSLQPTPGFVF
jgi:protein-L-isoaspartate(D-aspartate) O-methyltransferase